ncbi:hypothetical protein V8B55DRAFT_1032073 [Mucor lusitanicus]
MTLDLPSQLGCLPLSSITAIHYYQHPTPFDGPILPTPSLNTFTTACSFLLLNSRSGSPIDPAHTKPSSTPSTTTTLPLWIDYPDPSQPVTRIPRRRAL